MYQIRISKQARKDMEILPDFVIKQIDKAMVKLGLNPRPTGVKKLRGQLTEGWRIRIGDYRIIYRIDDIQQVVDIYRIKHRRNAYE